MENIVIKARKKVSNIEVIKADENKNSALLPFLPIDNHDEDFFLQELKKKQDYLYRIKNRQTQRKKISRQKDKYKIYEESAIPGCSGFLQIDLSKINQKNKHLKESQEEVEHAYNHGFNDAQQQTRTTFEIELQKRELQIVNFETMYHQMRQEYSKELLKLQEFSIPLAIQIAEYIIGREVLHDEGIVIEQIRKALQMIDKESVFSLHINPMNLETLKNAKNELLNEGSNLDKVLIVGDESINQGSCRLETSVGIIDASFSAQLEKLKSTLENNLFNQELS